MYFEEPDTELLIELGLTKTQSKLYLTLLKLGEADARTLYKSIGNPRIEIYRALNQLQKEGLIEKKVSKPYHFRATPIKNGLQILLDKKIQQCNEIKAKAKKLLQRAEILQEEKTKEQEQHDLVIIDGKDKILQTMNHEHEKVRCSVDILTTLQRWLSILGFCYKNYKKALQRGVKYRVVIENPGFQVRFQENVKTLLKKPTFELRFSPAPLITNAAVFDDKEVTVSFCPGDPLAKTPMILTRHPSFVSMCKDHFESVWKSAMEYALEKQA